LPRFRSHTYSIILMCCKPEYGSDVEFLFRYKVKVKGKMKGDIAVAEFIVNAWKKANPNWQIKKVYM